jgi:hypothetical protein
MFTFLGSELFWAIFGAIFTTVATCIALLELTKKRAVDRQFGIYKRDSKNRVWGHIQLILEVYNTLDEARNLPKADALAQGYDDYEAFLCDKITSARKGIVASYLRLIEQAISIEEGFNEETALRWRQMGRLENEWRYQVALKFLDEG